MTKRARRPGKDSRRRPLGTPSVVFLDDCRWNAFHQLAPRLRRAGVRTIRVSTEGRRKTRIASRLLFDRYAILADGSDVGALRDIMAGENVVDIQFAESLGDLVAKNADLLHPDVAEQVGRRISVVDKFVAAGLFSAAGVRTPEVVPVADATPAEIAARFGFPIVVKERIGYGGERVSIIRDLESLAAATSGNDGSTGDLFYEQYVDGTKLDYAAVVSSTGIEQELAYQVTRWRQPVGRASEVETIDDAQLVAFGRRALDVVGCTGLVNMDVIRDDEGVDWLIDFNARAFGGSGSFLAAGIDTSEGYLRAIGLRTNPPKRTSSGRRRPHPGVPDMPGGRDRHREHPAYRVGVRTRLASLFGVARLALLALGRLLDGGLAAPLPEGSPGSSGGEASRRDPGVGNLLGHIDPLATMHRCGLRT